MKNQLLVILMIGLGIALSTNSKTNKINLGLLTAIYWSIAGTIFYFRKLN